MSTFMFNAFFRIATKLKLTPIRRKHSGEYFVPARQSKTFFKDKTYSCQFSFLIFVIAAFVHSLFKQKEINPVKTALILLNLIVVLLFGVLGFVGTRNAQDLVDLLNYQVRFIVKSKSSKARTKGY